MTTWIISASWRNPYCEPPNGRPRELGRVEIEVPDGQGAPRCPPELEALCMPFGSGYGIAYAAVPKPVKHWPPERRFAYRRKRLESRIRKKFPMFAEQFIQEAIQRKPEYYGVTEST